MSTVEQKMYFGTSGIRKGRYYTKKRFNITRKVVAYMTASSWEAIPHCSSIFEPDVTEIVKEFKKVREESGNSGKLTINTLMIKVFAEALKEAPELNSFLRYNKINSKGTLDIIQNIDVSMPTVVKDGTTSITMKVKDVGNKSLAQINEYVYDLRRRAENTNLDELYYQVALGESLQNLKKGRVVMVIRRLFAGRVGKHKVHPLTGSAKKEYYKIPETERLCVDDVTQGTLVVSNIGSLIYGKTANQNLTVSLIEIVPPQTIALGFSGIQEKPGVVINENGEKEIAIRSYMPITIVFDHRPFDFEALIPFIKKIDDICTNPEIIAEWMK